MTDACLGTPSKVAEAITVTATAAAGGSGSTSFTMPVRREARPTC